MMMGDGDGDALMVPKVLVSMTIPRLRVAQT